MGAPKGNNFWERRSKHGRDLLFETPELMWEAACEYFQWCVDNPLMFTEFVGKDATEVEVPKVQAFTYQGLCIYLGCNTAYFRQFKETELGKTKDFSTVLSRIEEVIYHQKFIHAAAGFLNANIIARDLGLAEKSISDNTHTVSEELVKQIANKLNA